MDDNSTLTFDKTKDRLYKIMMQSDWQDVTFYNELKSQYKRYRAILRKNIREAKRLYHIRMFDTFNNDIKKIRSLINNSLNRGAPRIWEGGAKNDFFEILKFACRETTCCCLSATSSLLHLNQF